MLFMKEKHKKNQFSFLFCNWLVIHFSKFIKKNQWLFITEHSNSYYPDDSNRLLTLSFLISKFYNPISEKYQYDQI